MCIRDSTHTHTHTHVRICIYIKEIYFLNTTVHTQCMSVYSAYLMLFDFDVGLDKLHCITFILLNLFNYTTVIGHEIELNTVQKRNIGCMYIYAVRKKL